MHILYLVLGGALGTLARYGLSGLISQRFAGIFPWGTLGVNLLGSFLIGILWGSFERSAISPDLRCFIFLGFLGAFTTFSTYALEGFNLLRDGEMAAFLSNFVLTNAAGFALVYFGFVISRSFILK